jgi:IclR family transcriptional regulator, acetate operon repressor
MANKGSIKVVAKIGQIMRAFLTRGGELHLSEIAEEAGIEISTASRLVGSLVAEGLLRYDVVQRTYSPGLTILELSRVLLNRFTFRELAHRELIALSREYGWQIYLAILDENTKRNIVYIDAVTTRPGMVEQSQVGQRRTLHTTATGKLFLAFGGVQISDLSLTASTPNTITDPIELQEEVGRIRDNGYAVATDEEQIGVSGIAIPIFDKSGGIVVSIGASTDTSQFEDEREKMINELRIVASGISSIMVLTN